MAEMRRSRVKAPTAARMVVTAECAGFDSSATAPRVSATTMAAPAMAAGRRARCGWRDAPRNSVGGAWCWRGRGGTAGGGGRWQVAREEEERLQALRQQVMSTAEEAAAAEAAALAEVVEAAAAVAAASGTFREEDGPASVRWRDEDPEPPLPPTLRFAGVARSGDFEIAAS